MSYKPTRISEEALNEFKAIYLEEFPKPVTDFEIEDAAVRVLSFFAILATPEQPSPETRRQEK
jgi:hypothetical protein